MDHPNHSNLLKKICKKSWITKNKWCDENKMKKINENKTNCMLLGTNQRLSNLSKTTLNLKVNDIALDNVKNQKQLLVEIDSHLDYNAHLDKL